MTSEMKKTHTKDSTFSMTFTIIMTSIRTVSFSYSQTLFNTYLLIYNDDQKSYIYSFTGLNTYKYFPYIIYSLSPLHVPTYLELSLVKKKKLSPESLIGIVCGTTSIFFLILYIVIFSIRKKTKVMSKSDYEYSFSSDDKENTEVCENKTNIIIRNDQDSNDLDIDFWM